MHCPEEFLLIIDAFEGTGTSGSSAKKGTKVVLEQGMKTELLCFW